MNPQKLFIDAAVEAVVSRFIPKEFGANIDNAKPRTLPTFIPKVKIQEYLADKAKASGLTYTFIYVGGWLDAGPHRSLLISSTGDTTTTYDNGNVPFSAVTMDTTANGMLRPWITLKRLRIVPFTSRAS